MVQKHSNDLKKPTGGKKGSSRKTKRSELGGAPTLTMLGEKEEKEIERVYGGNMKIRLRKVKYANVTNPNTKETKKVEILAVIKNPTNPEFDKRKIISKGAIIRTSIGEAIVTSRPGQEGIVNAKLLV